MKRIFLNLKVSIKSINFFNPLTISFVLIHSLFKQLELNMVQSRTAISYLQALANLYFNGTVLGEAATGQLTSKLYKKSKQKTLLKIELFTDINYHWSNISKVSLASLLIHHGFKSVFKSRCLLKIQRVLYILFIYIFDAWQISYYGLGPFFWFFFFFRWVTLNQRDRSPEPLSSKLEVVR